MSETKGLQYEDVTPDFIRLHSKNLLETLYIAGNTPENCAVYSNLLERARELDTTNGNHELETFINALSQSIAADFQTPVLWELPEEFKKHEIECKFPVDALPDTLKNYLVSVCANLKISHEQAALPLLSALSLCVQGKAVIESAETGSFCENLCLFTLTVAPSGERKSSTFKAFTKPITDYVNDYNDRHQSAIVQNRAKRDYLQAQYNTAKNSKNAESRVLELAAQLHELKEIAPLIMFVQNTTVEALKKEMVQQSGRMGIMSGEAGAMDVIAGMYNNGNANIDDVLDAYDGTAGTSLRTTGNTSLHHAYLTICLLTQPDHFEKTFKKNKTFEGRGMLERFLIAFPERNQEARKLFKAPDIPEEVTRKYNDLIQSLLNISEPSESELPRIKHSRESGLLFENYYHDLEKKQKTADSNRNSAELSFLSKQMGRALRIAGILHLCENSASEPLSGKTASSAIDISIWTENERTKGLSAEYTETPTEKTAQRLLKTIKQRKLKQLSGNDISQVCRWCDSYEREAALELLEDMRYLKIEEIKRTKGRPKRKITVNPVVFLQ